MQKIKDFIYYNRKEIITIGIITLLFALYPIFIDKKGENEQIVLEEKQTIEQTKEESKNVIDIKGEVINPGTYEAKDNERVIDIIKKAGGLTDKADLSNINLSEKIYDEMVIRIYSIDDQNNNKTEEKENIQNGRLEDNKISINSATESELMQINGNKYGKFKKIEDLKNVSGIGDSTFEKIKDSIKI